MKFREQLPGTFRHRFESLGGYVSAILEAKHIDSKRLSKDRKEFIQIVVFVTALKRFLFEGSRAAEMTLEELKKQGIDSFSIGSSRFEEGSEDLMRGYQLASELVNSITDPKIKQWVESDRPLYEIIDDLDSYVSS
jgi:hypothetical protein